MSVGLYTTAELIEVQRNVRGRNDAFWLQWFPDVITSEKQDIYFDEVDDDRRLAPFVAPNVQGRVMKDLGYTTKSFRPAYLKPKHIVDPSRAIARMPGEPFLGSMSLAQRRDAIIAQNLQTERRAIELRWEWMAAQAIILGSVTVSGDDYPTTTVDFGRHSSLTYTLAGTARWGQSAEAPLADIAAARKNAFARSNAVVRDIVFGLDAWDKFIANADVKALLSTQTKGAGPTDFNIVPGDGTPFEFQGEIAGTGGNSRMRLWTYSNQYDNGDGTTTEFLDSNWVVGVGEAVRGARCFGAIMDDDANLQPLPMFPSMWKQKDPSATFTMTQSAPLMVPRRPNNTFLIKTNG